MKLSIQREAFLEALQQVAGAVERRQTSPVLGNILIEATDGQLTLVATDTEIEMQSSVKQVADQDGITTLPARKLLDICRYLPESARIDLEVSGEQALIKSGRSRYKLQTLPAEQFPRVEPLQDSQRVLMPAIDLLHCIRGTAFSMAQQDVRFYLNGMLLEMASGRVSCVATDGHRLAYAEYPSDIEPTEPVGVIIPRKSVNELQRLLGSLTQPEETSVQLDFSTQALQVSFDAIRLSTKLIDGRFPDYNRVIPIDGDKELHIDVATLRQVLTRASILSNEKYRGVRLALSDGLLGVSSHNPENEEANDEIEVDYTGESAEIGFNVTYLLDVLNAIDTETVCIRLRDGNSSALISPEQSSNIKYVVMPMRL